MVKDIVHTDNISSNTINYYVHERDTTERKNTNIAFKFKDTNVSPGSGVHFPVLKNKERPLLIQFIENDSLMDGSKIK